MTSGESRKASFQSAHIAYEIAGASDSPAVVLLHPAFADRRIFEHQIKAFSERYRVIAIDMPGHGDTSTKGTRVTLKDAPAIIESILLENGIGECHLIGVSLGGLVAQAFADRYPERVRSVTVVGGYSIHRPSDKIKKAQRREALKWLFYIAFSMRKFKSYVLSVSCFTKQGRSLFERGIRRFERKSFAAMSGIDRLFRSKDTAVAYPLFIMAGEHDLPLALETAEEWHAVEPNSELDVIAGAGHCANADKPEAFNERMLTFLLNVR
ncbi:MAG: alpha/beta hydrolase [Cohnella sp.]|nr:alpha/beta hydrolase [Cohnella sp.]